MNFFPLYPLYIDPGMGSMLFSVIIGLAATLFFAFQAFIVNAKFILTGGKAKQGSKNKFVIYAEDKRYYTFFKPILEEFENRGIELLYLTASKDDPVFDAGFKHIKPEFIGEGNKAFARLNFLSADFVLATTPGLDVYQWKRSKRVKHYSHICHSLDEQATYELFGMDYFDSILVSGGDFQKNTVRKLEEIRRLSEKQVVTAGCPYLDEYAKNIQDIPEEENHVFTVLVSPSWGDAALLSRFGEKLLDPLASTDWRIIIRPHPQSLNVEKEMIDRLTTRHANSKNVIWDFERDNIYSLKKADVMISDFSGIILDYMFLRNKPVIYVNDKINLALRDAVQLYENHEELWTFRKLKKTGVALNPEQFNELPAIIKNISQDTSLQASINDVKEEAWHYKGESGKQVADFMINTAKLALSSHGEAA